MRIMEITETVHKRSAENPVFIKIKQVLRKIVLLTVFGALLGVLQGWAAARTYKPEYEAGFATGFLHGMLLPAALPGLLMGHDVPIYAPNNTGVPYKIGLILGIDACGTIFFGISFWQRQKRPPEMKS